MMDHTMFPLHQGNVIHFSNSPHNQQHKIFEDLILDDYDSLLVNDCDKLFNFSSSQPNKIFDEAIKNHDNCNQQMKKKMVHKVIERQRRKEMATFCSSLRSLLPLEFIKVINLYMFFLHLFYWKKKLFVFFFWNRVLFVNNL